MARFTKMERVQLEGRGLFPVHPQHTLVFEFITKKDKNPPVQQWRSNAGY